MGSAVLNIAASSQDLQSFGIITILQSTVLVHKFVFFSCLTALLFSNCPIICLYSSMVCIFFIVIYLVSISAITVLFLYTRTALNMFLFPGIIYSHSLSNHPFLFSILDSYFFVTYILNNVFYIMPFLIYGDFFTNKRFFIFPICSWINFSVFLFINI